MKDNNSTLIGCQVVILAVALVLCVLPRPGYCQLKGTTLLLQQTSVDGGTIIPAEGVHYFELYSDIALTAISEPGYEFVYWLGDVSDPAARRTFVYLDAPKIVIGIFERSKFDFLPKSGRSYGASGGGLFQSARDYSRGGGGGGGGRPESSGSSGPAGVTEGLQDLPTPEGAANVPVPEPATVLLLGLGAWLVLTGRPVKG